MIVGGFLFPCVGLAVTLNILFVYCLEDFTQFVDLVLI